MSSLSPPYPRSSTPTALEIPHSVPRAAGLAEIDSMSSQKMNSASSSAVDPASSRHAGLLRIPLLPSTLSQARNTQDTPLPFPESPKHARSLDATPRWRLSQAAYLNVDTETPNPSSALRSQTENKVSDDSPPFHSATAPPPSTPRKLPKADDSVFLPPARNEKPRESPAARKTGLNVTTGEPLDSDDEEDPGPRRIVPIRYTTDRPACTTPPPSPMPSIEQPPDDDMDDGDHGMNTPPPPAANQGAQVPPAPALGHAGPAPPAAIAPGALPTHGELMALTPIGRAQNPHLARVPAQPAPTNNAEGRAPFMKNNGNARNIVITCMRVFANVQITQRDEVMAHLDEYLAFTVFLGGQRYFAAYKNILDDIYNAVASIASPAEMTLFRAIPVEVQTGDYSQKYRDPFVIFAHFTDPTIRTALRNQRLFAVSRDLAWYADTIDPACRSWTVGVWGLVSPSADIEGLLKAIRAALILYMCSSPDVIRRIAQMTQANDGLSAYERTLRVAESVDSHYFPHKTDPLVCVYMKPVNNNEADNEALKRMLRVVPLAYKMYAFTPKSRNGDPTECVMCKADSHLAYLCPLPNPVNVGDEWWGPPDQMSKLTEGILATNPGASRPTTTGGGNNGGGNNRNGGWRYGGGNGNRGPRRRN
ncbi:hypothetical protein DFH09DRAFT_1303396 [Mycena vulgaris]|nr:hypothetical protein DFH09DRAFT_1303396 [Mycena vulgaris]